jgi:hypothetical protein
LIVGEDLDSVVLQTELPRFSASRSRVNEVICRWSKTSGRWRRRQSVIANLGRADQLIASGAMTALLASGAQVCDQCLEFAVVRAIFIASLPPRRTGMLCLLQPRPAVPTRRECHQRYALADLNRPSVKNAQYSTL